VKHGIAGAHGSTDASPLEVPRWTPWPALAELIQARERPSGAAFVLAFSVPFLFLHPHYQPSVAVRSINIDLNDLAVLAVLAAACLSGALRGFAPLRQSWLIWLPTSVFAAMLVASVAYARSLDPSYALGSHVVSALKFVEYALLAPAVPLLLRRNGDLHAFFVAVAGWAVLLSAVAILQFLGIVPEFEGKRPGQREPSLVGVHELGALSAAVLMLGLVVILAERSDWQTYVVIFAGGIGVAIAAAFDSVTGVIVSSVAVVLLTRRRGQRRFARIAALCSIVLVVGVGAVTLRSSAISASLQFIGLERESTTTTEHVQSYAHRTLLGYIGLRIWLDHPVFGVGWQGSMEPAFFGPQLTAAHRRFPSEPPEAFPAPNRRWGVQNGAIQLLADHGVVGLLVVAAMLGGTLYSAGRVAARNAPAQAVVGTVAFAWVCIASAVITGVGIWPGFAGNTLLWIAIGLAAASTKLAFDTV
jgi:O-Antigen ligase